MRVAFATDNGETFIDRHFGDAEFYDIYEIEIGKAEYIKRIVNSTEEEKEHVHADPNKAKGIAELFKNDDIKVLVSKVFGANIQKMKKKFVCVLMNNNSISESILKLQESFSIIESEWNKGDSRNHLNLKKL